MPKSSGTGHTRGEEDRRAQLEEGKPSKKVVITGLTPEWQKAVQ